MNIRFVVVAFVVFAVLALIVLVIIAVLLSLPFSFLVVPPQAANNIFRRRKYKVGGRAAGNRSPSQMSRRHFGSRAAVVVIKGLKAAPPKPLSN